MSRAYQFEDNLTAAVATVFLANISTTGFPKGNIFTPRESGRAETPRIELEIPSVMQRDDHMRQGNSGIWYFDTYEAELETRVVSNRTASEYHGALCGRVRYLLSREANLLVSPALTLYEIVDIRETGSATGVDEESREDITTFRHLLTLSVLPNAF